MGIMDLVKKWKEKNNVKSEKFKEMEEDYRLQKMLEDRQKSSNERQLEKYFKKQREDAIAKQVKAINDKQTKASWKEKSCYGGKGTMLKSDKNMMDAGNSILKQKNIFKSNRGNGGFKW